MNAINEALHQLLKKYSLVSRENYLNAFKEIIQEIALLGLWRAKFFEHAAFYGGTALRILYGLDRFSEDLDFSLLQSQSDFKWDIYFPFIISELESYGFSVAISQKNKTTASKVESAFLKANTLEHLLKVNASDKIARGHKEEKFTIKIEVDIDPPQGFATETQFLLEPNPFSVRTFVPQDLFAGKLHALLCREWIKRIVKGRDWYDFVWYIRKSIPVNLKYLEQRMRQSGNFAGKELTHKKLLEFLEQKIASLDIAAARKDVEIFLKSTEQLEVWSKEFFMSLLPRMQVM
jgi:hypothetical protein